MVSGQVNSLKLFKWFLYFLLSVAACVTLPILFLVPSTLRTILGLGIWCVGMEKCLTRSGDKKFLLAPLSMSALTWEWSVLEWNITGAWMESKFGLKTALGNKALSIATHFGPSKKTLHSHWVLGAILPSGCQKVWLCVRLGLVGQCCLDHCPFLLWWRIMLLQICVVC